MIFFAPYAAVLVSMNMSSVTRYEWAGERELKSAFHDCCSSAVVSSGAAHYAVGRPLDGALNSGSTNSMITAGQGRIPVTPALCLFSLEVHDFRALMQGFSDTL